MANKVFDYLIVGQGIAGSVLAMTLIEQNHSVYVVDSPSPNTSSKVAAGIMNPITGKRMTLSWEASTFFPEAIAFYSRMEQRFNANFLIQKPIVRVFSSVAELNDWSGKYTNEKYKNFVTQQAMNQNSFAGIDAPNGSLTVSGGGRLNTRLFLKNVRDLLIESNCFEEVDVDMRDVVSDKAGVTWKNVEAKAVIYCTGTNAMDWSYLPFTPMKGEVLEVSTKQVDRNHVFVGGCFFCPTKDNQFYAGATYDWRNIDLQKTETAKTEILDKLSKFVNQKVEVVSHRVGIRPATKDRRPLVGAHPNKPNQYLFSGLGSKGVSMAPNLAMQLVSYIRNCKPLHADTNLNRFNQ